MKLIKLIFSLCAIVFLTCCTTTTTKIYVPEFTDISHVQEELIELVPSENIHLEGQKISTNNKTTYELEISITNGQRIPAGDQERNQLGKMIAKTIKDNLKDPKEFGVYKVLFISKTESGNITKSKWVGDVFKLSELD